VAPSGKGKGARKPPGARRPWGASSGEARALTATAEILRVISNSPGDVQPVFEAIVRHAARLCDATFSAVVRFDGRLLRLAAVNNMSEREAAAYDALFPREPGRHYALGRAFVDAQPVHIVDIEKDPDYDPNTLAVLKAAAPYRTYLGVPIVLNGVPVGVVGCGRRTVKPFTAAQIALVQTFAEQAAIAIENARLLNELQSRNLSLAESLEQQTATAEILRVISRSPTGIQPTFEAIAAAAKTLCDADNATLFRFDGTRLHFVAHQGRTVEEIESARAAFPQALSRGSVTARAIAAGATVQIDDVSQDAEADPALRIFHTVLSVPLMRDGQPLGGLTVARRVVQPFSAQQIALLETFAEQAVIAIENVRLFTELAARNTELSEALEQQTATSEILRVISRSPTDIQPVLDALTESAARLCEAQDVSIFRRHEHRLVLAAHYGAVPFGSVGEFSLAVSRASANGRAVIEARTIHVADVQAEAAEYPEGSEAGRRFDHRALLNVPLVRNGLAIGTISLRRREAGLFTPRQVALLQTFADQAVIAIENVRLFTELDRRNAELRVALEQQTATSELLKVIGRSTFDLQPVFDTLAENAVRLCGSQRAFVYHFDGQVLNAAAWFNAPPALQEFAMRNPVSPDRHSGAARAALERRTVHILDVTADPEYTFGNLRADPELRTVLAVPMLRAGELLGVLLTYRHEVLPFTDGQIALMETFADQAAIAIENARLLTELQTKNRQLSESLEQQTATSEILRVISSSPTDVTPVFEVIVERACRLCDGVFANAVRFDGVQMHAMAHHGFGPEALALMQRAFPAPPHAGSMSGRAILAGTVVQAEDITADRDATISRGLAGVMGYRSQVSVPILKDGAPVGAITVARRELGPFPARQVELLRAFADQAVIALENVRLFTELEVRNTELRVALDQQTSTSELLKVIGRSTFDLHPVFETLAQNGVRLCEAERAHVFRFDGALLRAVAAYDASAEVIAFVDEHPIEPGRASTTARAAADRRTVHIHDTLTDPEYTYGVNRVDSVRTVLSVPMLRANELLGVITIYRTEVRPFTDGQIALIETFADQAAIAIENARLLTELQTKNADLTQALEQQTATSEILRAISSSPTDAQPVFDTIVRNAVRLCSAQFANVFRLDGDMVHLVAHHNVPLVALEHFQRTFPQPLSQGGTLTAEAMRRETVVQVEDIERQPEVASAVRELSRSAGYRSALAVPVIRNGRAVGAIGVGRSDTSGGPKPFSDKEVELLQTFADQAVIAIENVRLFTELEARNTELRVALEQQTATSELLKVIGRSTFDLQPVFETLAENAVRLCEAERAIIWRSQGTALHAVVTHNASPELRAFLLANPITPGRTSATARAALERRTHHVHDAQNDAEYTYPSRVVDRFRTILAIPMLRADELLGVITIFRHEVRPFTDGQIGLMETFADQAAIAIENARLLTELQGKNADLTTALERQTATAEILRVISSSPTDVGPVFSTILRSAVQLSGAGRGALFRYDGELIHLVAHHNQSPEALAAVQRAYPMRPSRIQATGRAILSRAVCEIPDVRRDPEYLPGMADEMDIGSILAVPMLRADGSATGVIIIQKSGGETGPFAAGHVELLKTFADQAVIAIENVRLFTELEARNSELRVALEQQTATSELLKVIGRSTFDLQPVFETLAENAVRLCEAERALIYRFDGTQIQLMASHNASAELLAFLQANPMTLTRSSAAGRVVVERRTIHIHDVLADPDYVYGATSVDAVRTVLGIPMRRGGELLGVIVIYRHEVRAFTDSQIALMETFADQAAIAIENARLLTELQGKNAALTEALEQQTATSEILRVISSSPTDLRPVLAAIAEHAVRLCEALNATVLLAESDGLRVEAHHGPLEVDPVGERRALTRGSVSGRAVLEARVIHLPDALEADNEDFPLTVAAARRLGHRTVLATPLVREGAAIGALFLRRAEPRAFSDKQIALVRTFADQAVIAIQNVRLFKELEARNSELRVALEQQTATSELLKVIGQSTFDLQPVFETLAENAVRLCEAERAFIFRLEDGMLRVAATHNVSPARRAFAEQHPIRPGRHSAAARAALERRTIHIHDIQADPEYTYAVGQADTVPTRTVLGIPMLRADDLLGVIIIFRQEVRPFTDSQIALMETFADQAAIAIENARLLTELQTKNADLTETLEQQTATAEILRVISRSPTDIQPVLDTVAHSTARLCEAPDVSIFLREGERLRVAARHGDIPSSLGLPLSLETGVGVAVLRGETVHVADIQAEVDRFPVSVDNARRLGFRAALNVPLMRDGVGIGAISLRRVEAQPFSERQVALLETFADQAVIAIQNVRLFTELEARNSELRVALEQQTATAEVLRVISRSQTDVQPVFVTILESALRLCEADLGGIVRVEGSQL